MYLWELQDSEAWRSSGLYYQESVASRGQLLGTPCPSPSLSLHSVLQDVCGTPGTFRMYSTAQAGDVA